MILERFQQNIENHIEEYKQLVLDLYEHPEIGNQEFESSKKIVNLIQKLGFETRYPHICPTGFQAEYQSKKPGYTIGFLCEYDALPEIGHGCGHNLICTMSIAAATALKTVVDDIGGKIILFGTPAEENFGGKITFAQHHAFDGVDLALMLHPSNVTRVGGRTNALFPLRFEFFGKNAHAANPYEGRSALDAAVQTYTGISMLRQFILPNSYIHGIIKKGGEAANIIPAYAMMEYYFRAPRMEYAKDIANRATAIAEGAAKQFGVEMKHSIYECPYDDKKINYTLSKKLKEIFEEVGLENIEEVCEIPSGSSDIGVVSYLCPTIEGQIQIAPSCIMGHSKEMASATISKSGTDAILKGGMSLAKLAYDFSTDSAFNKKVKEEFLK